MKIMLSSKIRGKVTGVNLTYDGSITIGKELMGKILPFEQVHVMNVNTGARFITYAIRGEGKEICLNGAAARLGMVGDDVIILTYEIKE